MYSQLTLDKTVEENQAQMRSLAASPMPASDVELPCQQAEHGDLWFAEATGPIEAAKRLCSACPIKQQCLQGALERGEPWGVWGGEVFVDGAVVARKRGRGRPRKQQPATYGLADPAGLKESELAESRLATRGREENGRAGTGLSEVELAATGRARELARAGAVA